MANVLESCGDSGPRATKPRSATAQLLVQLSRRVGDDEDEDGKEVRILSDGLANLTILFHATQRWHVGEFIDHLFLPRPVHIEFAIRILCFRGSPSTVLWGGPLLDIAAPPQPPSRRESSLISNGVGQGGPLCWAR